MRISQTTDSTVVDTGHPSVSAPRLIAAGPAISLIDRWRTELIVLQRRSPASDAAATLADCLGELIDAINEGDDVTLQLTIADAHAISRMPLSTLRWLCKHKPLAVGARKREGAWYLDRTRFEAFINFTAPGIATASEASDAGLHETDIPEAEVPATIDRSVDIGALVRAG